MLVHQASENVYGLSDRVCVIYYGPTSFTHQYFIDQLANRQTTPDFLVAVTDPNARIVNEGYENRVPRTPVRAIATWLSDSTPAQSATGATLLALTLYTGYNIPEPSMIGTLRWITYINVCISSHVHYSTKLTVCLFSQPLKYVCESIVTNEFRTLDLEHSNLVPQGPGYEAVTSKSHVCTVAGAVPGQTAVNGLQYIKLSFDCERSRMWRVRKHFVSTAPSCPHSRIPHP